MAYADQKAGSGRIVALIIVGILHVVIGYAFISGLAYKYVKKVTEDTETFVVEEPPPPPEEIPPPPPPPEQPQPQSPPPVVTPPPIVRTQAPPPVVIQSVTTPPPTYNPVPIAAPPAPPAPVAPPAPPAPVISKAAGIKGNPGSWVTDADYPASALNAEEEGVSGLTFEVNAAGRIENCRVSSSSGSSTLDRTACRLVTSRGRYTPALDAAGRPTFGGTKTLRFTWKLPADR